MVLQNCQACNNYWLKNGRNMYGYQLLVRDQHIPEAHVSVVAQSSSSEPVGDHSNANYGLARVTVSKPSASANPKRSEKEEKREPSNCCPKTQDINPSVDIGANTKEVGDHSNANAMSDSVHLRRIKRKKEGKTSNSSPKTRAIKVRAEDESHAEAEAEVIVEIEADNGVSIKDENVMQTHLSPYFHTEIDMPTHPIRQTHQNSYFQAEDKTEAEVIRVESDNNVSIRDENVMPTHDEVTVEIESDNDVSIKDENVMQTHPSWNLQAEAKVEAGDEVTVEVEADNIDLSVMEEENWNSWNWWRLPAEDKAEAKDEVIVEVKADNDETIKDENDMMQTHPSWYFQLYKAAMDGEWESVEFIVLREKDAAKAKIRGNSETALHVVVGSGHHGTIFFIQNLLQVMSRTDLEATNSDGCTALAIAAKVGNVEAAKLLVAKNTKLLYISSDNKSFPIHYAAEYGQKEMLLYLLQVTQKGQSPDPYDPETNGPELLRLIIKAELYDAALLLLQRMPELATSGMDTNQGLLILAENPSAFSCWRNEGVLQPIIYSCVPELQLKHSYIPVTRDIENVAGAKNESDKPRHLYCQRYLYSGLQLIHQMLWVIFEKIVPFLHLIKSEKKKGHLAKKLVKCLCKEASNNLKKSSDAALLFKMPLLLAAENGIPEIVKEITNSFPDAIWYHDDNNSEAFRLAIKYRHHEVYNLLYEMGDMYINIVRQSVEKGDNILHLAGYLAPSNRLRIVSGAALQMQRELQWFKEIESLVQPAYKNKRNDDGKTPRELFTESHHKLLEEGEKWMRDTANSCTVAAALIATIAFAAAITVPGGNNGDNGRPMFGSEKAFIIFGVADALSLFTSCASILMFLSILTSRFAEDDFLRALPTRLIVGLIALFISVAALMAAFSSTLYLMFGDGKRWILGCVIAPSCLLVAIFTSMHISLLGEIINNTYRCGIFKKKNKSRSHYRFTFWNSFCHKVNQKFN